MSPRRYSLGKREAGVQQTRERIIEAARSLIVESGFQHASLVDVARRADVTRATVYYQFESRLGLLEAVASDWLRRARLERLQPLMALPDARDALHAVLREGTRLWATDPDLVRRMWGLAAVDAEVDQVVRRRDAERKSAIEHLVRHLFDQGLIRSGCSLEQATAVISTLSGFAMFDELAIENGLPVETVADLLIALAGAVVS